MIIHKKNEKKLSLQGILGRSESNITETAPQSFQIIKLNNKSEVPDVFSARKFKLDMVSLGTIQKSSNDSVEILKEAKWDSFIQIYITMYVLTLLKWRGDS